MANGAIQRVEIVGAGSADADTVKLFKFSNAGYADTADWTSDGTGTGGKYIIYDGVTPENETGDLVFTENFNNIFINYNHRGVNQAFDMRFQLFYQISGSSISTYYIPSTDFVVQSFPAQGAANASLNGCVIFTNNIAITATNPIDMTAQGGFQPFSDFNSFPTITPTNYVRDVVPHNGMSAQRTVDIGGGQTRTVKTVLYVGFSPASAGDLMFDFTTTSANLD